MKDFDQEMWQDFTVEVHENLEEFEPNLLLLEQQPDDSSILNDCFRNMHSIKGAANYMGLSGIAGLAHAIENLFDQARQGTRSLEQDDFDLMFKCVDRFKELIRDVAANQRETLETADLVEQIKAMTEPDSSPGAVREEPPAEEPEEESVEDQELLHIFAQEMKSLYQQMSRLLASEEVEPGTLDQVLQDMERVANYIGKDRLHKEMQVLREELSGHSSLEDLEGEFLRNFSSRLREALGREIELDDDVSDEMGPGGAAIEEDTELYGIFLDFFKEVGSPLASIPEHMDETWMSDCQKAIARLRTSANYMDYMEVVHLLEEWEECITEQLSSKTGFDRDVFSGLWERLCDKLPNLREMFEASCPEEPGREDSPGEVSPEGTGEASLELDSLEDFDSAIDGIFEDGNGTEPTVEAGSEPGEIPAASSPAMDFAPVPENFPEITQAPQPAGVQAEQSGSRPQGQMVRVNLEKVENLLEDVAELVVLRSSMGQSTSLLKALYSRWRDQRKMPVQELKPLKEILLDYTENVAALERVVHQLQDGVMRMRMLPVSSLFNRYPRMVRDLCQKLGKEVELSLKGSDTALDKQVIEQLADPLQHIIRNAVDHGIEPADFRSRKGKSPKGHLSIAASQEGNFVIISISDDGRGLDREHIVKKAISSGVITADALRDMSEEQVWNLVFVPGISTAGSVSDISGRGVGLDVVKRNIEKIGGAVVVRSWKGKGTTFILRIPLTLAIIKGLTVMVGNQAMVIPISAVYETFRLSSGEVSRVEGYEIISRRQETLPLIRLGRIFRGTGAPEEPERFFAVRVRLGELDACLGVDGLVGQQEVVIKPLSEYLMDQPGFAGATILGDGAIALILDLPAVLEKSKGFISKRQQLLERAALGLDQQEAPVFH